MQRQLIISPRGQQFVHLAGIAHGGLKHSYYMLLTLLCSIRTLLTIEPKLNVVLLPTFLSKFLYIKLNDLVVVMIWVLIPILCGKSITKLYTHLTSLRQLWSRIFDHKLRILQPMPVLAILLTGASGMYIPRLVMFIYDQWGYEFFSIVQTLQIYPAVLMLIQTFYQGTFILWAYGDPQSLQEKARKNPEGFMAQLQDHVVLNVTLLLHCVCITVIVEVLGMENNVVVNLAAGEMGYRLFAAIVFYHLQTKVESYTVQASGSTNNDSNANPNTNKNLGTPIEEENHTYNKDEMVPSWPLCPTPVGGENSKKVEKFGQSEQETGEDTRKPDFRTNYRSVF